MRYRWNDFVSNQRLLHETESKPITSIVRQRQLRLYGHVARYLEADSASRLISERDNPDWRTPRGRPQNSWLRQVDASCLELNSMGMGLERGDRQSWCRRVDEATRLLAYAPNDLLIDLLLNCLDIGTCTYLNLYRHGVYTYLPYSPDGSQVVKIAFWTPANSFRYLLSHVSFFQHKFDKFVIFSLFNNSVLIQKNE